MKHVIRPEGIAGGHPGRTGDIRINPETEGEKRLPSRYADYPLKAGDVFRLDTPGGGGFGHPLDRDPELVLKDVRERYVSPESAFADYGVVLCGQEPAWVLDHQATLARRAELRSEQLQVETIETA
jgi:N-methylhydantoinase B